jgi:hypothetical protein
MSKLASGIAALLLCAAGEAPAQEFRETVALRLTVVETGRVLPNEADLGYRLTVAATVRLWKFLELEGDFGLQTGAVFPGVPTGGLRVGFAYPFRDPGARFQLDGVFLAGYRALFGQDLGALPGWGSRRSCKDPCQPGLPQMTFLHVAELNADVDVTLWVSARIGLTVRLFVGALVAPWASYVGVAPEAGAAGGIAF